MRGTVASMGAGEQPTRVERLVFGFGLALVLGGCPKTSPTPASDGASPTARATPQPKVEVESEVESGPALESDWTRDVLATDLEVDIAGLWARATIEFAPSSSTAASLEIGDLEILAVHDAEGRKLRFADRGDTLDLELPASTSPVRVEIDYHFAWHPDQHGAMAPGSTLTWPNYCGNLFPCKSDPADGLRLSLSLSGVDDLLLAVYPKTIPADAPAYQLAWAIGDYQRLELGKTRAGTKVTVWYLPESEFAAEDGTASLLAAFDWLEQTYGAYRFGDQVGSVEAPALGRYAGMEHHPFWHVDTGAMDNAEVHVHEAVHGWFGAGVRIACWQDLVLSEGTTTYLTARAIEAAAGPDVAAELWAEYRERLARDRGTIARPPGCGDIDVLGFFNGQIYVKGVFFYRALEQRIGRAALDRALADVYARYQGQALGMQELFRAIEASSGYDPEPCAIPWLYTAQLPADIDAPCPADSGEARADSDG